MPNRTPWFGGDLVKKLVVLVIALAVALGGGMALGVYGMAAAQTTFPFSLFVNEPEPIIESVVVEQEREELVTDIKTEEEVVLVSMAIEGFESRTTMATVLGKEVPLSDKTKYVTYSFTAKLGINGKNVTIEENPDKGENAYLVTIPEFEMIGFSDPVFSEESQAKGLLSWTTDDADTAEILNEIMGVEKQDEYLANYERVLKDQAKLFYTLIIHGVDPTATLDFEFADAASTGE